MILRPIPLSLFLLGAVIGPPGADAETVEPAYLFNFDNGEQGFTADTLTWRRWYMVELLATGELGEGLDPLPTLDRAWGTSNGLQYPSDLYAPLWSPELTLDGSQGVTLELWHRYDTQLGGDGGQLLFKPAEDAEPFVVSPAGGYPDVIPGESLLPEGAFTGTSGGWGRSFFDLTAAVQGAMGDVSIAFLFQSNGTLSGTGWLIERVQIFEGDRIPPLIRPLLTPEDTFDYLNPAAVEVQIKEPVTSATLEWRVDDGPWESAAMDPLGSGIYRGEIPPQPPGSVVAYHVYAEDAAANIGAFPDVISNPSLDPDLRFAVTLPAPLDLGFATPPPRITTEVTLRWTRPPGQMPVLGYNIYRMEGPRLIQGPDARESGARSAMEFPEGPEQSDILPVGGEAPDPPAPTLLQSVPAAGATQTLTLDLVGSEGGYVAVTALFEGAEGEIYEGAPTEGLRLGVAVPALREISPALGYQGQRLTVQILGKNTDFAEGQVGVLAGEGVQVLLIEVLDVTELRVTLAIAQDAALGPRALSVQVDQAPRGEIAFGVASAEDRPGIAEVSPPRASQAQSVVVKFVGKGTEFTGASPTVDFGVGVLVTGAVVVEEGGVAFTVPIQVTASCPVGQRSIIVKTEAQTFTDVPFEIRPGGQGFDLGCQSGPGGGPSLWALLGLLGIVRRRRRREP